MFSVANMKFGSFHVLNLIALVMFAGCGVDESLQRCDSPKSSPAAAALSDPILPPAATEIYYLDYAGGMQDLERYVRFRVPTNEVDSTVDGLIQTNNAQFKRTLAYPRTPLAKARIITPNKKFLPMPWWTPSSITNGYFRGDPNLASFSIYIWVNSDTGTIFIYQND
jgi:hypothetical protein